MTRTLTLCTADRLHYADVMALCAACPSDGTLTVAIPDGDDVLRRCIEVSSVSGVSQVMVFTDVCQLLAAAVFDRLAYTDTQHDAMLAQAIAWCVEHGKEHGPVQVASGATDGPKAPTDCKRHVVAADAVMHDLAARLPEVLAAHEGTILYYKRNEVWRCVVTDGSGQPVPVIVKRYRRPKLLQRLCYSTFWTNKAVKAYHYGLRLLQLGIDTPRPLAALTLRNRWGMVCQYYLVTAESNDLSCEVLTDERGIYRTAHCAFSDADGLIDALARYLVQLHELGFLHGDTNLSNFRWHRDEDGRYQLSVIDINRSRFLGRQADRSECIGNLYRLTHVRSVLDRIVTAYARQRGWDAAQACQQVHDDLDRFEKRKARLYRLTGRKR